MSNRPFQLICFVCSIRSRDRAPENFFKFRPIHAHIWAKFLQRHKANCLENITWSELGKQNIHITARRDGYITLLYTYWEILTKDFSYANVFWPIRGANDVSSRVRTMIRPITSHRGVHDIPAKIQALYIGAYSLQRSRFARVSQTFNKKRFSRRVFLVKKLKNIPEIGLESFPVFLCRWRDIQRAS